MKKIRYFIVFAIFLCICILVVKKLFVPMFDPRKEAIDSIFRDFSSYAESRQLVPISTIVSAPEGVIRSLGMGFQIRGPLSQSELRDTLFMLAGYLNELINSNESIRRYLLEYPFSKNDCEIVLFVVDDKGGGMRFPYFSVADIHNGGLHYKKYAPEGNSLRNVEWITESYEDALEAARTSQKVFEQSHR